MANSLTAQVDRIKAPIKAHGEVGQPSPSKWYGDVIHNGSPRTESIHGRRHTCRSHCGHRVHHLTRGLSSKCVPGCIKWHPSLDFSCVNAVRQVRIFGPPEGGTKDSLNVIYDCSYHPQDVQPAPEQDVQQAPEKITAPVADTVKPSHLYMKQMAERIRQNFHNYELVDAKFPQETRQKWLDVNRDGSLSNVKLASPAAGFLRLRLRTGRSAYYDRRLVARELQAAHSPATFACTYDGSNALHTSRSVDSATEDRVSMWPLSATQPISRSQGVRGLLQFLRRCRSQSYQATQLGAFH